MRNNTPVGTKVDTRPPFAVNGMIVWSVPVTPALNFPIIGSAPMKNGTTIATPTIEPT